jgi:hypothetical protein
VNEAMSLEAPTLTRALNSYRTDAGRPELEWVVAGRHGAVTFTVQVRPIDPDQPCGIAATDAGVCYYARFIGIHSAIVPVGWSAYPLRDCTALGRSLCWYDRAALAADALLEKWAAFGFDDAKIYGELAEWYRDRFAWPPAPPAAGTWPVRCVYCGGEVGGLLASCERAECVPLEIARDVRLDRDIEAAEG